MSDGGVVLINSMRPPSTSVTAAPHPYRVHGHLDPGHLREQLRSQMLDRSVAGGAEFYISGFAFARSTNSFRLFALTSGCTATMCGENVTTATGAKSQASKESYQTGEDCRHDSRSTASITCAHRASSGRLGLQRCCRSPQVYSTTTGLPSAGQGSARRRADTSVEPPGEAPTIIVIALSGKVCAPQQAALRRGPGLW